MINTKTQIYCYLTINDTTAVCFCYGDIERDSRGCAAAQKRKCRPVRRSELYSLLKVVMRFDTRRPELMPGALVRSKYLIIQDYLCACSEIGSLD